jgi:PAS domain S-box-containing protein
MTGPVRSVKRQRQTLEEQVVDLKTRLDESENVLRTIRSGNADAIIVDTSHGDQLFVLKGSEQPYREMVETMSEGAVTATPGGAILYCNQRFAEMAKANLETIIGSNLLAYYSGEDGAEILTALQESHASVPRIRTTLLASDATPVPVNMAMRRQNSPASDSIAIVITDLTKWQHAEQTRERAIRALRITNACADVVIHATDEAGMLADVCRTVTAVEGYKSVWIGPSDEVSTASFCPFAPSADQKPKKNFGIVLPEPIPGSAPGSPSICPRSAFAVPDGQIRPARRMPGCVPPSTDDPLSVTVPLISGEKFFGCWVFRGDEPGAFDDEELALLSTLAADLAFGLAALRDKSAHSQLAAIVTSSGDAIVGRDLDGTITSRNNAAEMLFGYRTEEMIGRSIAMLCPRELIGETDQLFDRVQHGETIDNYDTVRLARSGRRIDVTLTVSPVRSDTGCVVGAAVFLRDCAARKGAEAALMLEKAQSDLLTQNLAVARDKAVEASQAKSRFLATVTHDLRTPLHGILGYAELLTLEGHLAAAQLGRLEAIATAGNGLLDTINAVLDMSQIEANSMELRPVEIELPDFLSACLDVIRSAAEAKGLALARAPIKPLRVVADPGRLRQVLINLLGNAVKFTATGSVEVRLGQAVEARDFVRVEVADTGPGIWARHRDKLFNAFERLNAEAMSGIEGSGLGLAIAARLVRLMGGQIGYDDNPGGGSVFWLEIPRSTARTAETRVAAPPPRASGRCLRVLVVGDEALNRNIASGFLGIAGHDVVCVDNGAAAVEAAAGGYFEVILMDVRMPGMNGQEATRLIRALPPPRGEVRVVAVTAQAFAEQVEILRQAGMNGHVSKPFKQTVLLAALENVTMAPNDTKPAPMPAPGAPPAAQPDLPIHDSAAFEDIAGFLSAAELGENLQILISRCEALLGALRRPEMLSRASELAEMAHKLAGGGGTFGFLHMAAVARRFEQVVESGTADANLADGLSAAIEASLLPMQQLRASRGHVGVPPCEADRF